MPTDHTRTNGAPFSKSSWERFAAKFPAIRALHAIPDDEGV
jgi:hypothetical protein